MACAAYRSFDFTIRPDAVPGIRKSALSKLQGYSDFPSLQCDKCTNKDICKYIEENKSVCDDVANITMPLDTAIPICITVECKKFAKNKR